MTHLTKEEQKRIRKERMKLGNEEYDRRVLRSLHRNGVWFYRQSHNEYQATQRSKTEPTDLLGEYDIVYVAADDCEFGAQRTARGTVTIGKSNATVKLDDAVKETVGYNDCSLLSDFRLSNLTFGKNEKDGSWECKAFAKLEEYEYLFRSVHEFGLRGERRDEHGHTIKEASIFQVSNRVPCPWREIEYNGPHELYMRKEYESLEEAEEIHSNYMKRHEKSWLIRCKGLPIELAKLIHGFSDCEPSPVFFFEPGDLQMEVCWSDEELELPMTYYVLRKRQVKQGSKRKREESDFEHRVNENNRDISDYIRLDHNYEDNMCEEGEKAYTTKYD